MAARAEAPKNRGGSRPWLWPGLMVIVGVVLLLDNFLLLGDFDATALLPLLLVFAGAQVLLRGDLIPLAESRPFGVTRGSVEAGTLEINSGEIDVELQALQREERLIAGQFGGQARPSLNVQDTYVHINMKRSLTPWWAFADWRVGLAHDLPWQILISTSLGQINVDLSQLIIQDVVFATGIGDIRMVAPKEALGTVYLQSAVGDIHVTVPEGYRALITIKRGWFFNVHHNTHRYGLADGTAAGYDTTSSKTVVYESLDADPTSPLVEIHLTGTFGDAYLV